MVNNGRDYCLSLVFCTTKSAAKDWPFYSKPTLGVYSNQFWIPRPSRSSQRPFSPENVSIWV